MADVYQNWILYNVGKAIKNWTEYPFDWTMLNEYNQLVTYYDTAQQQIRTSIINKWVNVPANATIDEYPWYIDQIDIRDGWLYEPQTLIIPNAVYNSRERPEVSSNLWDAIKADGSAYYRYFWLWDSSTTAYGEAHLCVFVKTPLNNPTLVESDWVGSDRFYFHPVARRMKKSGNDIIFSALWYEYTDSTSSARDHYYCWNVTNNIISSKIDLWIVWEEQAYTDWTTACGITAEESIAAINKITVSTSQAWGPSTNYVNISGTINR